ncbi:hypothetical protein HanPI659440_Chr12g0465331 [Helianthus annuus]|nr:hypothetical protein HanPI659440_Chr12g0465331 [Helianthus annuus]
MEEVEEKLESGQGKTAARRFFSRFCTPIFLEPVSSYNTLVWKGELEALSARGVRKNAIFFPESLFNVKRFEATL